MAQKNGNAERKEFGAKVKAAREKKGMTAEAAAKHLEMSSSHLYAIEGGRTNMSAAVRNRLEGFIASASTKAATSDPRDIDVMPLIDALAGMSGTVTESQFLGLAAAYKACEAHGITFGAQQILEVLARLRD